MNKDKVKEFIVKELVRLIGFYDDERIKAFDDIKIKVYPQSFGRLDIIISSKYGCASRSGVTRYAQVLEVIDKFRFNALYNFYTDFYRNHSR